MTTTTPPTEPKHTPVSRVSLEKKIVFSIFLTLLLFSFAEIALRVRERVKHGSWSAERLRHAEDPEPIYRPHAYLGATLVPGSHMTSKGGTISINSLGYRGPEISLEKKTGVIRVACTGGSTTFGVGPTADEKTWPYLLEQKLRRRFPDKQIEVINAGVAGYTSAESLINYELRVTHLDPDIVIILDGYNDLKPNRYPGFKPDYSHWKKATNYHFRDKGLLYDFMSWSMTYLKLRDAALSAARKQARRSTQILEKHDTLDDRGIEVFQRNIENLVTVVQSDGAVPVIMTFPSAAGDEISDAERDRLVSENIGFMPYLTSRGLVDGLKRHNQVLRDLAKRRDLVILDMDREFPRDPKLFCDGDEIHANDAGCALWAELAARDIIDARLIETLQERE